MSDEKATVTSLTAHRLSLQAEVLGRYQKLKEKGVEEQSARNTAAAQASLYGKVKPSPRAGVYRTILDDMLKPRKAPRPSPPVVTPHWRLPE